MATIIDTIQGDLAKIQAAAAPFEAIIEEAMPIISLFVPAADMAIVTKVFTIIKAIEATAPDFEKNLLALIADVKAVSAAVSV